MSFERLAPYMTSDPSTISPEPAPPTKPTPKPTSDMAPAGNICDGCHLPAGQLRRIGDGPWHCEGCHDRAERVAREKALEPLRRKQEAEMEKFREQQRRDGLRPPLPEHMCEIHSDHGRAEILRGGILMCRACAAKQGPRPGEVYDPPFAEAPMLAIENRVAALEAAVAALAAQHGQQGPKTRKAVG
jgi:hypothetical protein